MPLIYFERLRFLHLRFVGIPFIFKFENFILIQDTQSVIQSSYCIYELIFIKCLTHLFHLTEKRGQYLKKVRTYLCNINFLSRYHAIAIRVKHFKYFRKTFDLSSLNELICLVLSKDSLSPIVHFLILHFFFHFNLLSLGFRFLIQHMPYQFRISRSLLVYWSSSDLRSKILLT